MTRLYQVQLELDYQDTYADFLLASELAINATGKKRQALLNLRTILKNTIKEMEKEMERF
jgi:hypothetical protein